MLPSSRVCKPRMLGVAGASVSCETALFGDLAQADVVKIHKASGKVSFLVYDDFEGKPLPELQHRVKVNLKTWWAQAFDHSREGQLLYFKERDSRDCYCNRGVPESGRRSELMDKQPIAYRTNRHGHVYPLCKGAPPDEAPAPRRRRFRSDDLHQGENVLRLACHPLPRVCPVENLHHRQCHALDSFDIVARCSFSAGPPVHNSPILARIVGINPPDSVTRVPVRKPGRQAGARRVGPSQSPSISSFREKAGVRYARSLPSAKSRPRLYARRKKAHRPLLVQLFLDDTFCCANAKKCPPGTAPAWPDWTADRPTACRCGT